MSFNPPNNPIDLSGGYTAVSALLQLLVDPVASKQRLDEHIAAEAAAKERIEVANKMTDEARRLLSTAQATNIVSDRQKAALEKLKAELEQKADQLGTREARCRATEAKEAALNREKETVAAMRKDYENKLAQIQNLAGNLHH
jgi:hypothetical protein